jgi:hypothetical protein
MCVQRARHLMEHVDSRILGPSDPVVETRGGKHVAYLLPELP